MPLNIPLGEFAPHFHNCWNFRVRGYGLPKDTFLVLFCFARGYSTNAIKYKTLAANWAFGFLCPETSSRRITIFVGALDPHYGEKAGLLLHNEIKEEYVWPLVTYLGTFGTPFPNCDGK